MKLRRVFLFILTLSSFTATAQTNSDKLQWFRDAKLGIFIHWGIYSVNGVDESWSFYNKKISWEQYMSQLKGFTASKYDPQQWAELIKKSGAKYSVITTKHHDGVALFNSKVSRLDVVDTTPAKRDVLALFYKALRERNIKTGAYFSLLDWSHPDYNIFTHDSTRYTVANDKARWNRFLKFTNAQIDEVLQNYHPDLVWFDGDWEHSAEEWNAKGIRSKILAHDPKTIINGRLQGQGDYATPEQNFPVKRPETDVWELCMTTNKNWGYHPDDTDYKTPYEVITIFADVLTNGGNLLLDIGPREDGFIPDEQVNILTELGKWNNKHAEAIFSTLPGLPQGHFYGPTTLSKDSLTLYLFLPAQTTGKTMIRGLKSNIESITILGTQQTLQHKIVGKIHWSQVPGLVYIDAVPLPAADEYMTVLKIKLKEKLSLHHSGGL